jgi:hypothetical protein
MKITAAGHGNEAFEDHICPHRKSARAVLWRVFFPAICINGLNSRSCRFWD